MAVIIVFGISFILITALLLSKHREIKVGEKTSIGKTLAKFDRLSEELIYTIRYRIYQLIQTVKFVFLVRLPEKGKVKISSTKESVLNGYLKQKEAIMGKKEMNGNGSSSFFLRHMNENKNGNGNSNGERGKIE